jgi:putative ABC transport system permease protein
VEALTLALIGGGIGVGLGLVGSGGIAYFAQWSTLIRADTIAVAVGFSGAVGIFFGFYPAHRASCPDPIEALRR